MISTQKEINHKLRILKYAEETGSVSKTCRYFGISRQFLYKWRRRFNEQGEAGLVSQKRGPKRSKIRTPVDFPRFARQI